MTTGEQIDATVHSLVNWLALPDVGGLKERLSEATASVQDAFADARLRLIDLLTHCEAVSVQTRERYCDTWQDALSDPHFVASVKHQLNKAANASLRQWMFTGYDGDKPFIRQSLDDVSQPELNSACDLMHKHLTDGTSIGHAERSAAAKRIFRKGFVQISRQIKQSSDKPNVKALKISGRRKLCRVLAAVALGESMDIALEKGGYRSPANFFSIAKRANLFAECGLEVKSGSMSAESIASHLAKNGRKPISFSL